jgi:hypothetical protein
MGIRGHGKSYLACALMREFQKEYPDHTIFIHDSANCFPLTDFETCFDTETAMNMIMQGKKRIRLVAAPPGDMLDMFDFLMECDDIWILIDEANQLFKRTKNTESVEWIIDRGRHRNIAVTMITHNPPGIPIEFTSMSTYCFHRVIEPCYMDYIKKRLGEAPPEPEKAFDWFALCPEGELTVIPAEWIKERN